MIRVGHYNTLTVRERHRVGLRLGPPDDDVLLPASKVPRGAKVGDTLEVFVYTDSEDRPVATTERPKATVGEMALLEVIDLSPHGAFLDWGLDKDLLVPTREQHTPLRVGQKVVVAVAVDRDGRVMAAARLAKHFDKDVGHLRVGQQVQALVYDLTDRGARVVVDGRHSGMLFDEQPARRFRVGDSGPAYITAIRPDGRLDLANAPASRRGRDVAREALIKALAANGGFLPLNDRSHPEEIRRRLNMSKKAFKRAVGGLYKDRAIELTDDGIRSTS